MHTDFKRTITILLTPLCELAIAMAVLALLVRLVAVPQASSIAKSRQTIAHLSSIIETETGDTVILNEIRGKQTRLQERYQSLTSDFSDPADLSGLLQMVFDKAWKSGIKFDKTQPQPEVRGEDCINYPILFEMNTSYHSLGRFISDLERMPMAVRVDRLALDATRNGTIDVKLMLTCFLRPTQERGSP
jgi:Tfp pilus assembly protein PilO